MMSRRALWQSTRILPWSLPAMRLWWQFCERSNPVFGVTSQKRGEGTGEECRVGRLKGFTLGYLCARLPVAGPWTLMTTALDAGENPQLLKEGL